METKIIAIANEKGGVAKTTSTGAIGSVLSRRGYKTVMVDLDPQADLTVSLNVDAGEKNIFDCIFTHKKIMASQVNKNLVLVGGSPYLNPIDFLDERKKDVDLQDENEKEILKSLLDSLKGKVDYILLDCPPNKEIITTNALVASDYVIIPSEAHAFSTNGIISVKALVERYQRKLNPNLKILGILLTRYRSNTAIHSDMAEWLNGEFPNTLFKTKIHENITIQEATQEGQEIEEYQKVKAEQQLVKTKKPFRGLKDYGDLVDEILEKIEKWQKQEINS